MWRKRESLENKKSGPHSVPWALTGETIRRVLELKSKFEEIATNYVISIKAGISASSVGKIFREHFGPAKEEKVEKKVFKTVDWLKVHVCWATDTIKILSECGYVYAQFIVEEYSRCILGWILSYSNTADRARTLLERVINEQGLKPLLVKSDRGSEFQNEIVKSYLKENEIVSLPSPGHYPPFNGKMERENEIIWKFLPEKKGGLKFEEIYAGLEKAMYVINHELPRAIFDGKTSADIFKNGEIYKNEEKEMLLKKVEERINEIEKEKIPGVDKLSILRKAVVKSVVDMGLCMIKTGEKNVNQFAG